MHVIASDGIELRVDEARLRQVMLNILSNAARHTPSEGTMTIRADQVAGEVVVEVHIRAVALAVISFFTCLVVSTVLTNHASALQNVWALASRSAVTNLIEAHVGRVWVRSDDLGVLSPLRCLQGQRKRGADEENCLAPVVQIALSVSRQVKAQD